MFGLLRHLFKFQFLFVVAAVLGGIYHTEIRQFLRRQTDNYLDQAEQDASFPLEFQAADNVGTLFTPAELAKFNGEEEGRPLYLALLGSVFDVSRGIKHYGSGCSYNFFDYVYKGRVIGRFYDEKGALTTYHHKFLQLLEQARDAKRQVEELRARYPGCNIEWSEERGTRVWCTTTSGDGKERSWIGYPRKLYSRGNKSFQCACVPDAELDEIDAGGKVARGDAMLKPYDKCEPQARECFYKV
ncbi:GM13728 [Drosophila sechellia]|uniref:GM13728 n=1 Tax=Drosophila sechellia TaxID=7238 RepID=B4IJS6_DROSE|nr:GM13728 [Drosophila sechellia]